MKSFELTFSKVKVSEKEIDVLVFSEEKFLKIFNSVYPETFYIENSKFGKPTLAVPGFSNENSADVWIQYWVNTFKNPSSSCQTCPTVRELMSKLEAIENE